MSRFSKYLHEHGIDVPLFLFTGMEVEMEEHTHDWVIGAYEINGAPEANPYCIECSLPMTIGEAEARLNATERLGANMAMALCRGIHPNFKAAIGALTSYANILEGK